jgi:hypothetical protein
MVPARPGLVCEDEGLAEMRSEAKAYTRSEPCRVMMSGFLGVQEYDPENGYQQSGVTCSLQAVTTNPFPTMYLPTSRRGL